MSGKRWPTLQLDIEPDTGRISMRGGGKGFTDKLNPGEFFSVTIGEYTITFQRKRANKIIKMPKRERIVSE
jgi:hypothetical protein